MNKLRSDSAFCQLTPQQADALEGWLFEERLGYPKVVEKLKAEFGLETSLTAVRRFYQRLDVERSAQSLMDATELSGLTVQALKSGELKPAMLLYANKCLFELLRQEPVPIKEVTTLMRAITSAEARAFRQTVDDREQAELKEAKRVRKVEAEWRQLRQEVEREDEELRQKQAKEEAKESAGVVERESDKGGHLSPALSPKGGEGEDAAASFASVASNGPQPSDPLAPRGTSGERAGERGFPINPFRVDNPETKDVGEGWQPSVVEEPEYAESHEAEAAENRLAPLNAA